MAIRDSIVGAIQSGQMAVGQALTGGGAAVASNDNGAIPLLEDLRSITRENEGNTERLTNVLREMFAFDKSKFARDRDQARELEKEKTKVANETGSTGLANATDFTGGLGAAGLAAIASLAYFAKELGANTDILKLPQQLKSIKSMATFAKGIGTISTLGLGPAIVRDFKLVMKQFGTNIKTMFNKSIGQPIFDKFDEFKKFLANSKLGQIFKSFDTKVLQPIRNFFSFSKGAGPMAAITGYFDDAKRALTKTFAPIKKFFTGLTKGTGLFAAAGPFSALMAPLRAVASGVSKLFLPLAAILGIFDGVSGFTKEYENTGSIVDGIRGAVVAIVDGFIGSFVRLITDLVGMALEFLGLDNLGGMVAQFGEDVTKLFGDAVGGIVDFIMGIVTLDLERIWSGLTGAVGSAAGFFARVVTAPIDMAVNFVKDIFGFGDPEQPFSLLDFFLGEDGPVMSAFNWFKSLFTIDFSSITKKIFDMGRIFKALAAGGIAAAKAILPGGESPTEAFTRVYNDTLKKGQMQDEAMEADRAMGLNPDEFANTDEAKAAEAMRQEILKENTTNNGGSVTYVDNSNKQNQNISNTKAETYTGKLDTGIDSYHDRAAFAFSPYG